MAEKTFLSRWDIQVREIPALNYLHQPDIGRSYPLFAYEENQLQTRHFYHTASQTNSNTIYLGAPTICVLLDYETGGLLNMFPATELGFEPFKDTTYTLTNEQKEAIRPQVKHLRELYDLVVTQYPYEPGSTVGKEFWATFQAVVPPMLLPYYEALAPDFVAWCNS